MKEIGTGRGLEKADGFSVGFRKRDLINVGSISLSLQSLQKCWPIFGEQEEMSMECFTALFLRGKTPCKEFAEASNSF